MARNIKKIKLKLGLDNLKNDQDKENFVKQQKEKSRISRKKKKKFKELTGVQSRRIVIRESAAGRKYVLIKYKKVNTGKTKTYMVAPYSYRFRRRPTGQLLKALYAFDFNDKHIKSFYLVNILSVSRTNSNFKPRWPVEIIF